MAKKQKNQTNVKPKRRVWNKIGDTVHLFILLLLVAYAFRAIICVDAGLYTGNILKDMIKALCSAGINDIFTFIGAIAFILFGIVGIYEYGYMNGIYFLSPPYYTNKRDKSNLEQAEQMMKLYYERDIEFIEEYEKKRTDYMLQAMGLDEKQFQCINYEIIKARTMSENSIQDLEEKARLTVLHKDFIIDQTKWEHWQRVYDTVDYFINLYTALYNTELCECVAKIMCSFLSMDLKQTITEIDYLVVPQNGNLLLGLEVGKLLKKPVIAIHSEERIQKQRFWDGNYKTVSGKKNKIVVIHDVLVTGKRIYESVEKLYANTYEVVGVYSLLKYKHNAFSPEEDCAKRGIARDRVKWLLEVDEELLKGIYEQ